MKAWFFATKSRTLANSDGRPIVIGETHEVSLPIKCCKHGLHGCVDILDALSYAPGSIVYRVDLSGKMDKTDDKIAAQKRTYLAGGIDVSKLLIDFACQCALDVAHLWDMPAVVREYLQTQNPALADRAASTAWANSATRAARAAASAAWAAARDARDAWAAWAAASAARDASSAARAAARDARDAWAARAATSRKKQSARLLRMVNKAIKEAGECQ
jgi:hypothetical protein